MRGKRELLALLERHGVRAKKSYGQNFLLDEQALDDIARAALLGGPSALIEIGPGPGALSERLAAAGLPLVAIEKDRALLPLLEERFADQPHVRILEGDALELDLASLHPGQVRPAVVGNIPYQISSALLVALIAQQAALGSISLMIQREVADRWRADPGSKAYGSLTVLLAAFGSIVHVRDVPPEAFFPAPKVHSSVIRIEWHERPLVPAGEVRHFERVVRAAFSQRRKMLKNALGTTFSKAEVEAAGRASGIALSRRAETLSLQDFSRLASAFPSDPAWSPSDRS